MDVKEKLIELSIEDALLVLREEHRQRTDSYTTYLAHGGKGDPAEEVGLDALAMAISALEKTKWISVKDRLPEEGEYVLCVLKGFNYGGKIQVCKFVPADKFKDKPYFEHFRNGFPSVTHWMPLPEPPKEVE